MITSNGGALTAPTRALIASNVARIQERIALVAGESGRSPQDIRLLPVTKYVDLERIRIVYDLGLSDFGENRVQEMRQKSADLADFDINWVLIGHLQTNKAAQAARVAAEVQSVDSVRIANALNNALERLSVEGDRDKLSTAPLKVLLQVNTSGEAAKYGLNPGEVASALDHILTLPHLQVGGFMTMAPFTEDRSVVHRTFADLRELRDQMQASYANLDLGELSMGMSHDYETAIREGATTVRIGTTIFGART